MHPLINSLAHLNENELQSKIQDLTTKYWRCNNSGLQNQIAMVLETYTEELKHRREETWKKMNKDRNGMFDWLINID